MINNKRHFMFLKNLDENLDDVLSRPEIPPLVTELQKKLPKVNAQTLEIVIAASFAVLDTIDADNNTQ